MTAKEMIEAIKTGAEAVKDILKPVQEVGGAIWDGVARHAEHGASELASAMYTGNAYVAYGWGNDGPDAKPQEQGNAQEQAQAQEVKPWEQQSAQEQVKEQDKGMEMEM